MVYIWVFDIVEDDILARHNQHLLSPSPQGCNNVTLPKAQPAQGIESFDQCYNKHLNLFNLQYKILSFDNVSAVKAVDSKKQLSKLSHLAVLSTLCHWVRICIHNPYIAEKMKWFVLQFERMILFRTAKRCFWGRQLLQDGVCFVQSSLINGNPHSSIAFVLFWHQEQRQNLMKSSAANCASSP